MEGEGLVGPGAHARARSLTAPQSGFGLGDEKERQSQRLTDQSGSHPAIIET